MEMMIDFPGGACEEIASMASEGGSSREGLACTSPRTGGGRQARLLGSSAAPDKR